MRGLASRLAIGSRRWNASNQDPHKQLKLVHDFVKIPNIALLRNDDILDLLG